MPDKMADGFEADVFPCGHEFVHFVPAVERNAERVIFQDAVDLRESGFEPVAVIIAQDAAAAAIFVIDDIGRVCQNQIDRFIRP